MSAMEERKRILAVDDDEDQVEIIRAVLTGRGFEVTWAASGAEALDEVRREKPDLLILDVMMEDMDSGFRVCQQIKRDPETSSIPVLMLTAIEEKTGVSFSPDTDGEFLPADAYLDKPIEPEKLIARVEGLLG